MIKPLPYALATGIIAAGFVSTTAVTEVSAASSYKLVKNKLVHSKTGKAVKNHAIYKKKLYKNGKLVTKTTVYKKFLFKKGNSLRRPPSTTSNFSKKVSLLPVMACIIKPYMWTVKFQVASLSIISSFIKLERKWPLTINSSIKTMFIKAIK